MSHIPGPWEIGTQDYGNEFDWCVLTEKAELVAEVYGPRLAFNDVTKEVVVISRAADEIEATVRLIASAPELLIALQALADADLLHSRLDDGPKKMHATALARAAIAKATGADK